MQKVCLLQVVFVECLRNQWWSQSLALLVNSWGLRVITILVFSQHLQGIEQIPVKTYG
jgi:hypothetical protein